MASSLVGQRLGGPKKHRTINRCRRLTIPLSLHDYATVAFSEPLPEQFAKYKDTSPESKSKLNIPFSIKLAVLFFVGLFFIHTLRMSCFDLTRTCVAILFSASFLPFVRPLRWLIRMVLRISFWAGFFTRALIRCVHQPIYRLVTSFLRDARRSSKEHTATGRGMFFAQVAVWSIASFVIGSGIPFLHIATALSKIMLCAFRLLRALMLLQYYMVLLAGLEFMIYLRIDRVIGILGAAWFRLAVQRVCSVLTWVDIILAISPSAYYYVHLSLQAK